MTHLKKEQKSEKVNAVIMGRKTWDSIPESKRPLKNRINVVLSRSDAIDIKQDNVLVYSGFEAALAELSQNQMVNEIFVIGGASIYELAMTEYKHLCKSIVATRINKEFECDTFISNLEKSEDFSVMHISQTYSQDDISFDYCFFGNTKLLAERPELIPTKMMSKYPKHQEMQYLEIIDEVIRTGSRKDDRTGTGIITKFGKQMRFDLSQSFPVLTTKDVFWRGLAEELFWFIKGDTNAKNLSDKKIKIWDGNASREFLDSIGLKDREEWDLGPVYGFQWRHFGAEYGTMHDDYSGQGVDQLAEVIKQIKTQPTSRRIVMTAWNPNAIPKMALPPCHIMAQFHVTGDEKPRLSCQMYQRSCDLGLGVPFNIASYALLTCMLAQVCGLERGEFVHTLGDSHVYSNHVEPLETQLKRVPHPFPLLELNQNKKNIEDFEMSDFKLVNYTHDKRIKMNMAV